MNTDLEKRLDRIDRKLDRIDDKLDRQLEVTTRHDTELAWIKGTTKILIPLVLTLAGWALMSFGII